MEILEYLENYKKKIRFHNQLIEDPFKTYTNKKITKSDTSLYISVIYVILLKVIIEIIKYG